MISRARSSSSRGASDAMVSAPSRLHVYCGFDASSMPPAPMTRSAALYQPSSARCAQLVQTMGRRAARNAVT